MANKKANKPEDDKSLVEQALEKGKQGLELGKDVTLAAVGTTEKDTTADKATRVTGGVGGFIAAKCTIGVVAGGLTHLVLLPLGPVATVAAFAVAGAVGVGGGMVGGRVTKDVKDYVSAKDDKGKQEAVENMKKHTFLTKLGF